MTTNNPSAMSEVEYIENQISKVDSEIEAMIKKESEQLRELYYRRGKLYSQKELLKRVQPYD